MEALKIAFTTLCLDAFYRLVSRICTNDHHDQNNSQESSILSEKLDYVLGGIVVIQREDRTEEIVLNMICSHFLSFPTATFREQTFLLLLLVSLILLLLADYDW